MAKIDYFQGIFPNKLLREEIEKAREEYYKNLPSHNKLDVVSTMVEQDQKAKNTQVGGNHYKLFAIQPYEFCYKNGLNNLQSEAVSYIVRYDKKWPGDIEKQLIDLKKAKHTIELLIEQIENEQRSS